jgi:class 3 adenylate cyclase
MSQSRQLAAIMFTDIVGYTALMDENEQKAFDLLKKNRRIQRHIIEMQNGIWLK